MKEGDTVTVQLDPISGRVTYSKDGSAPLVQETSIRSTTTEPIHFCVVMMFSNNDVSIL